MNPDPGMPQVNWDHIVLRWCSMPASAQLPVLISLAEEVGVPELKQSDVLREALDALRATAHKQQVLQRLHKRLCNLGFHNAPHTHAVALLAQQPNQNHRDLVSVLRGAIELMCLPAGSGQRRLRHSNFRDQTTNVKWHRLWSSLRPRIAELLRGT